MTLQFSKLTLQHLKEALREDVGNGDVTSGLLITENAKGKAVILARESGIFCGEAVLRFLFDQPREKIKLNFKIKDGRSFKKNQTVLQIEGPIKSILAVERTALNFLGHLCGIATKTSELVSKVKRFGVSVLDTRKTTPLWRELEKYAVKTGGGKNHRMGLYDAVFVKENHRRFGSLEKLKRIPGKFEIEVRNMKEIREALELHPKVILFDNFKISDLKRAVQYARSKRHGIIFEASGGINSKNIVSFAKTGVKWISMGSLTHSVKSTDFSLLIQ